MFEGFETFDVDVGGVTLHGRRAGSGPPLLLLHGFPQTHAMWHRTAPALAQTHEVVCPDLRGYGRSSKPPTDETHAPYSKRATARDMVQLMEGFGHARFAVGAHDRGARVAHRMALDHPQRVSRLGVLDIAPTREMLRGTTAEFASLYWHWFFLSRPAPLPETLIGGDPETAWRMICVGGSDAPLPFAPEATADYLATWTPETIHAACEDYRAAATIDLVHDDAGDDVVRCPLLVLWGADGVVARCFDPLALWGERAADVRGRALPGGHYLAEEVPDLVLAEWREFFA